ncbi:MAG: N-acetylmuramoyl-L-alanine amidase [Candidatus Coatesbacteria bacterium]|nr:N-acetylmuramoyl-L-alanine amidase [Candidatus Coatesbacteria bacterium]
MQHRKPHGLMSAYRLNIVLLSMFLLLASFLLEGVSSAESIDAKIVRGKSIHVRHSVRRGDSYILISKQWTGTSSNWRSIRQYNGNRRLLAGSVCKIPYHLLTSSHKLSAITTLFPSDKFKSREWWHKVSYSGETVSSISSWLTGSSKNASRILRHNGLKGHIRLGSWVRIPSDLLLDAFLEDENGESEPSDLSFKSDSQGSYASYKLKKGEALYSSVVVRYTGKINHEDVMDAVEQITRRSGIRDVKKMPVGLEIRIPTDLLLPKYLPAGNPRRQQYETKLKEVLKYRNVSQAKDLIGVHVILDAGHGGADPGAIGKMGIHEDEYVYDIACRIRRLLVAKTRAEVHMTVRDKKKGYKVVDSKRIPPDRHEVLLTTPEYKNSDARVSANLRCFLSASIYESIPWESRKNNRVVFTSIHADSLYPALTGASIYIPDAYLSRKSLDRNGGIYDRTKEVRACRPIKVSYSERVRSEGYSRDFSFELISSMKRHGVATLTYHPVRDRITRGRREFVPAVIRYNPVPTKLLLEVGNLRNTTDCQRLMDPDYRERIAEAYVDALKRLYGRTSNTIASAD